MAKRDRANALAAIVAAVVMVAALACAVALATNRSEAAPQPTPTPQWFKQTKIGDRCVRFVDEQTGVVCYALQIGQWVNDIKLACAPLDRERWERKP